MIARENLIFTVFHLLISCVRLNGALENVDYGIKLASSKVVMTPNIEVDSSVYKSASRFLCEIPDIENPDLILYGTKAWKFPRQDINLTLSYPSENATSKSRNLITGYNVILFMDDTEPIGFITGGGILKESIGLQFTVHNVTSLTYEFWLYGLQPHSEVLTTYLANPQTQASNTLCHRQ